MLTLKESFNNVKVICDAALTNKAERNAIDESLNNIAGVLQQYEIMCKSPEVDKKQSEDEPDANED